MAHDPYQETTMKPTIEQQAIIDAAKQCPRVIVIAAGAGAGKTSTLKMLEDELKGRIQYTAFNSSLVSESKTKFRRAACNTTHSLAFRAVGRDYAHRLNGRRVKSEEVARMLGIVDMVVDTVDLATNEPTVKTLQAGYLAGQVLVAIRRFCQSADAKVETKHFRHIAGIDAKPSTANNDRVKACLLPYAKAAWADMAATDGQMPFTHDVYVKVWQLGRPVIAADYILLDEAQDTAEVMLDVLRQQDHAKLILVGDDNQSIYEWRGAVNAMAAFDGAPRKLLSQSFRFGQKIADVANAILATLEVPTDLVMRGLPSIASEVCVVEKPTCVLCRTNAGAVSMVLRAIGDGLRPHMVGKVDDVVDFVRGAKLLQDNQPTRHQDLCCFASWKEVQAYAKTDEGEELKLMVKLIDEFGCGEIIDALDNMPKEQDADLVVSTAHKSKGREWDSVKLAGDFPTVDKMCDADRRLLYVAATRAKLALDVSDCPTFGQKGIVVEYSEAQDLPVAPATPAVTPSMTPTPETETRQATACYTWARHDGAWAIRGPKGAEGAVEVVRKDGSRSTKRIGKVLREMGDVAIYACA
jgi:hypothetical protein